VNAVGKITAAKAAAKLPLNYEEAKYALAECARIDECKSWADKAYGATSIFAAANCSSISRCALFGTAFCLPPVFFPSAIYFHPFLARNTRSLLVRKDQISKPSLPLWTSSGKAATASHQLAQLISQYALPGKPIGLPITKAGRISTRRKHAKLAKFAAGTVDCPA
jgi:hypothetical protein